MKEVNKHRFMTNDVVTFTYNGKVRSGTVEKVAEKYFVLKLLESELVNDKLLRYKTFTYAKMTDLTVDWSKRTCWDVAVA